MKKTTKLMCGILSLGLLVTGCATVGNIKNDNKEIIFNGNAASMVDGYLYFANSIAESITTESGYKSAVATSYLARLNTNIDLASKSEDYSPKSVEKVDADVVGHSHSFMFVLGKYVYYATPNKQEFSNSEGRPAHFYNYSTFYRTQLNGNKKKKICTIEGEVSRIEVLEFNGKNYMFVLAGNKLVKISLGTANKPSMGVETISDKVTSVAIPQTNQQKDTLNWNGYVYYTTSKTDEDNSDVSGTIVNRIKVDANKGEEMDAFGSTLTFVGRENDVLFYTYPEVAGTNYTYVSDITNNNSKMAIRNTKTLFYETAVNKISALYEDVSDGETSRKNNCGYLFYNSDTLMYAYKQADSYEAKNLILNSTDDLSSNQVLNVNGRTIILSTSAGIYRVDLSSIVNNSEKNVTQISAITKMSNIYTNSAISAIDDKYIYFYAKLQTVETEEDEQPETDDNYYLYRASLGKNVDDSETKNYQLLSLTNIKSRRSEGK